MPKPWNTTRKFARIHQYVLTFVKGDPKRAAYAPSTTPEHAPVASRRLARTGHHRHNRGRQWRPGRQEPGFARIGSVFQLSRIVRFCRRPVVTLRGQP